MLLPPVAGIQRFPFAFALYCERAQKQNCSFSHTKDHRVFCYCYVFRIIIILVPLLVRVLCAAKHFFYSRTLVTIFSSSKLRTLAFSVIHSNCFEANELSVFLCIKCWFWYSGSFHSVLERYGLLLLFATHWATADAVCRHTDIIIIVLLARHLLFPIIWWRWKVTGKKASTLSFIARLSLLFFLARCCWYFVPVQFRFCLLLFVMFVYVMCYGLLYKCAMFDIERDRQTNSDIDDAQSAMLGCVFGCTCTGVSICHQFVSLSLARTKKNRFYYWRFCWSCCLLLNIRRNAKWIQMLCVQR